MRLILLLLITLATACRVESAQSSMDTAEPTPDTRISPLDTVVLQDSTPVPDDTTFEERSLPDLEIHEDAQQKDSPGDSLDDTELPEPPPSGLVINEVVTRPLGDGPDWFELAVVGGEPVEMGEYTIVDDDKDHLPFSLPDQALQPGDYFVLQAVGAAGWSPDPHVPFKLGGNDRLLLRKGDELADQVDWRGQPPPRGTSLGRLGEGPLRLLKPTPGADNKPYELKQFTCADPFLWDRVTPVEIEMDQETWQTLKDDPAAKEWLPGGFDFGGIHLDNVGVRAAGGGSIQKLLELGSDRFSFKVDFNRFIEQQKFCGLKKVVLKNGWGDPSLLREHLAYRVARRMGLKAPRTAFVDLTVAGQHLGIYTMVEPADDEFFLDDNFGNDKGDLYKAEGLPGGALTDQGPDFSAYVGLQVEKNEETTDHALLIDLVATMAAGQADELFLVLNIKDALQYAAWTAALSALDSYGGTARNYYLYDDNDIFSPVPWDAAEAFGSHSCGCSRDELIGLLIDEPTCGPLAQRPLFAVLLSDPYNADAYRGYLQEVVQEIFTPGEIGAWLSEAADLVRPHLEIESAWFYTADEFEQALVDDLEIADGDNVIGLAAFITERKAALAAQLAGEAESGNNGEGNCAEAN